MKCDEQRQLTNWKIAKRTVLWNWRANRKVEGENRRTRDLGLSNGLAILLLRAKTSEEFNVAQHEMDHSLIFFSAWVSQMPRWKREDDDATWASSWHGRHSDLTCSSYHVFSSFNPSISHWNAWCESLSDFNVQSLKQINESLKSNSIHGLAELFVGQ